MGNKLPILQLRIVPMKNRKPQAFLVDVVDSFAKRHRLSPRETEFVLLIANAVESNEEIAQEMGLTLGSAKGLAHNVYAKTGTSSKYQILHHLLREYAAQQTR